MLIMEGGRDLVSLSLTGNILRNYGMNDSKSIKYEVNEQDNSAESLEITPKHTYNQTYNA